MKLRSVILLTMLMLSVSACATRPPAHDLAAVQEYERVNDPLEPANRLMFKANLIGDKYIMRPFVKLYIKIVPEPLQRNVSSFLANLWEPWTAVNEILQGKPKDASRTVGRFLINTTIGIGGLVNVAEKKWDMHRTQEDFGQTLGAWGVGEGPYIVLPFFGPSNPRDTVGLAGDFYGDPVGFVIDSADVGKDFFIGIDLLSYIHFGLDAFDRRVRYNEAFDELYNSTDPYVMARSAYRQKRRYDVSNGEIDTSDEDDLFDEEFDEIYEDDEGNQDPQQ